MSTPTNHDDVIDLRDVIARVEELRSQRTDRDVAGMNMPDSDPAEFDNADDALEYVKDEAKRAVDEQAQGEGYTDEATDFASANESEIDTWTADENGEFGQTIGAYHYWVTRDGQMGLDEDEQCELDMLEAFLDDCKGYGGDEQWEGDWYPGTAVRDSYFKDYAMELADDTGAILDNAQWPCTCIDWDQAARELRMDYTGVEFDGVTYWVR